MKTSAAFLALFLVACQQEPQRTPAPYQAPVFAMKDATSTLCSISAGGSLSGEHCDKTLGWWLRQMLENRDRDQPMFKFVDGGLVPVRR